MSSLTSLTLWSDTARSHFFLIPDEHPLPAGNFVLRTLTGREQRVDEAALTHYEIGEEQAKEWVKGEFGKILNNARGAVNRFVEKLRGGPGRPRRIADISELLDRIETVLDLIVAEGGGEVAADRDIETMAEQVGGIASRLRQISESFRGTHAAAGRDASSPISEHNGARMA
jgi:hypothetical protein